jgi:hypothetical protein
MSVPENRTWSAFRIRQGLRVLLSLDRFVNSGRMADDRLGDKSR